MSQWDCGIPVRMELLRATALRRCIQLARFSPRPSGISITFSAGKSSERRNVSLRDDTNEPRSFLNYSLADSRQTTHRRCWLERIAGDHFIGDRRTRDLAAAAGVPERLAVAGIERKKVAIGVAGERNA